MIKILKHGFDTYRVTCDNCGCIFIYQLEDIVSGLITCPDCNNRMTHVCTNIHYCKQESEK